jgi:hypothetical protein
MIRSSNLLLTVCLLAAACAGGKRTQWDNVDYTPVYKAYGERENDPAYTQPSVIGCVDDDLYNCK